MAKTTTSKTPYHLYRWRIKPLGVLQFQFDRGQCVASFSRYSYLVTDARRRAQAAGYPKSYWPFLFDWARE